MGRYTQENHSVHPSQPITYRIPVERLGEFRMVTHGRFTDISGDIVDKLGQYEDLGSVEEVRKAMALTTKK